MDYSKNIEEQMEQYGGAPQDTQYFKLSEGANKIRVLSEGAVIASHWTGSAFHTCFGKDKGCSFSHEREDLNIKFLHWIIDRKDETTKLARFPYTIEKELGAYSANEDWAFDMFPMPYDITITAKNAGMKEVKYSVIPSPKRIELTDKEREDYEAQTPIAEVVERMKEKAWKQAGGAPVKEEKSEEDENWTPEDMPF